MADTTDTTKGTFVQRVKVEFEVRIDADIDYTDLPITVLREAAETLIVNRLGDLARSADYVHANIGVSGYRYFYPGTEVETDSLAPITIPLSDLLALAKTD